MVKRENGPTKRERANTKRERANTKRERASADAQLAHGLRIRGLLKSSTHTQGCLEIMPGVQVGLGLEYPSITLALP